MPRRTDIFGGLSAREAEVICLVVDGAMNSEIAAQLHLTEQAVKSHVGQILRKLGARTRTEAAVTWVRATEKPGEIRVVEKVIVQDGTRAAPCPACPACARRRLAILARRAGLTVVSIVNDGPRAGVLVASDTTSTGVLLRTEQDLNDLCVELGATA